MVKEKFLTPDWYRFTFRRYTAFLRVMPDVFLIGAMKSGTSSLFNYLSRHPDIYGAFIKEQNYFNHRFKEPLNYYRAAFPVRPYVLWSHDLTMRNGKHAIEATTDYFANPHTPARIAKTVTDPKFILLLRNPIDRTYSHYHHEVKLGREKFSFEEALEKEEERTGEAYRKMLSDPNHRATSKLHYSYIKRSLYAQQLKPWLQTFSKERFYIESSERFWQETNEVLNELFNFIGVSPIPINTRTIYNRNTYSNMNRETRASLSRFFQPHNEELYSLLGRRFDWD